jgi:NADH-quinone oxidoreductase subunit J
MNAAFYLASGLALVSTVLVVTSRHPVHALLYLVVSFLAVATVFFILDARFVALLEVMVYAGAIMVLFVYMIMMLNLGPLSVIQETRFLPPGIWIGPAILGGLLLLEMMVVLGEGDPPLPSRTGGVGPKEVGFVLLDKYYLVVELASMVLLVALVAAYHLGKRDLPDEAEEKPNR